MDDDLFENLIWDLFNLRPDEVSLVDEGANMIPFLITKEARVDKVKLQKLIQKMKLNSSQEAINKASGTEGDESTAVDTGLKILKALSGKCDKALLSEVLVAEGIIEKAAEPESDVVSKVDHDSAVAKAKEDGVAEGKASKDSGDTDPLSVSKEKLAELPPEMQAIVKASIAQSAETKKALDKVNKTLDQERDERITKQYDDQAKDFKIGIEGLGSVLKDVAGRCEKGTFDKLTAILKVASQAAGFVPTGTEGQTESAGGSDHNAIYAEMESAAKALFPTDKGGEAVAKFMKTDEGRGFYGRYEKAKRKNAVAQ